MHRHSVIITTHKRPLMLARAIQSVKDQSYGAIQLVIVSDVACAETYGVVTSMLTASDVFIQRSGVPGPAASRNVGLKLVDAAFVAFLDDDDAFTEDFFRTIDPDLDDGSVLYTDYHVVHERAEGAGYVPVSAEKRSLANKALDDLHVKNFIPLHCLVYPTAVVRKRLFDPSLSLNEDWGFLLDVAQDTPFRHVPIEGPIIYTRERADNRGRSNDHLLVDTYRRIYRTFPAPTPSIRIARQAFLQDNGIGSSLDDL
ncbi:glycosyltransferase [Beijerinckia sp. L45]|uniref:glycosyltransferase n=1 Tax=Beijerinckia sp. L45 TaxID=1641855 RepID=UPI00131D58ED|nr:glycosyltransferase [Beijerinckia sp. L45]